MKIIIACAVLKCLLIINCLQKFGSAAPTLQINNDVSNVSDVKRGVDNRNSLFSLYSCSVINAREAIMDKIQVII